MRSHRPGLATLLAGGVMLAAGACAGGDGMGAPGAAATAAPSTSRTSEVDGEVTIFAAASLTEAFTEIGRDFEDANPGTTVRFNFAGSSTLAQQILRGAPAAVFASANEEQMQLVADAGRTVGGPTVFVQNKLQIVVPEGNPARVDDLTAFGKDDLTIALCAEEVPCGAASRHALARAGVSPAPDTLEQDVKAVLTKVALGEVDAGLVYVTDVASAEGVRGIDFPEADKAINDYPIAVLEDAPDAATARAFVDFVLSEQGGAVLEDVGFLVGSP